jgi:glycosyltransferase involved in cell wall biosynthesis
VYIAIIIPACNIANFLPDAIRSVLVQTHADWSMVIVDDGSTDATAAVGASFRDRRISLVRQDNTGVSAARNAGIAAALSARRVPEAMLFLDGDDWLTPDALEILAGTLGEWPRAVAAVGRFARVGPDRVVRVAKRPAQGNLLETLLTRNLFANGGHLLIRRAAVEATGGFCVELTYGEDWEYWTRLALLGAFASVPCPAPLLFVRERLAGAYLSHATDPNAYRPALQTIYRNRELENRLGATRVAALARRAEAEMAWTVGRELIRHGRRWDGLGWLGRSICAAPLPKRLLLLALAGLGIGPYRPYSTVGSITEELA